VAGGIMSHTFLIHKVFKGEDRENVAEKNFQEVIVSTILIKNKINLRNNYQDVPNFMKISTYRSKISANLMESKYKETLE
jgi:hypothetical protein